MTAPIAGPIYYSTGVKGGVGKSMASLALADYYQHCKRSVIVVDGDLKNPDVIRCFESEAAEGVTALAVDLDTQKGWGEVVSVADEHPDAVVLINAPAATGDKVIKYGEILRRYALETGRPYQTVWMMSTSRMCCELLADYLERLPDVRVHVGLNDFYAEATGEDFTEYLNSKLRRQVTDKAGGEFPFPILSGHLTRALQVGGGQSLRQVYQNARRGDQMLIDGWRRSVGKAFSAGGVVSP